MVLDDTNASWVKPGDNLQKSVQICEISSKNDSHI